MDGELLGLLRRLFRGRENAPMDDESAQQIVSVLAQELRHQNLSQITGIDSRAVRPSGRQSQDCDAWVSPTQYRLQRKRSVSRKQGNQVPVSKRVSTADASQIKSILKKTSEESVMQVKPECVSSDDPERKTSRDNSQCDDQQYTWSCNSDTVFDHVKFNDEDRKSSCSTTPELSSNGTSEPESHPLLECEESESEQRVVPTIDVNCPEDNKADFISINLADTSVSCLGKTRHATSFRPTESTSQESDSNIPRAMKADVFSNPFGSGVLPSTTNRVVSDDHREMYQLLGAMFATLCFASVLGKKEKKFESILLNVSWCIFPIETYYPLPSLTRLFRNTEGSRICDIAGVDTRAGMDFNDEAAEKESGSATDPTDSSSQNQAQFDQRNPEYDGDDSDNSHCDTDSDKSEIESNSKRSFQKKSHKYPSCSSGPEE